ncbi:SemiSWEET family sugar transporter [Neolewinella litorea]|uniref:Glutathione synthetase n=1 Tax=Neolewinella litorea TaxID=2562452 RepID=A0A4S4NJT5_9BACT|nr:SemiSWEET transporter [Neolewinella litorea]THH40076.1 hypothetical protein E4021_10780 [Neolewinella litorea]
MTVVSLIGGLAALLTTAAFVPQAYKSIRYRDTASLSLATFSMLLAGTLLWLGYGYCIGDLPIIVANAVTASLAGLIFLLKLQAVYRARR